MSSLAMWVIYDHPTDYRYGFIARKWLIGRGALMPTDSTIVAHDIAIIQAQLEALGLTRVSRDESDAPQIVESWI